VQDDPPLPEDDENKEKRTDDISSWDADFLKVLFNPFLYFFVQ
jgi:S-phase kinase-associated protein 1